MKIQNSKYALCRTEREERSKSAKQEISTIFIKPASKEQT
jgi:hypothetical protein